MSAYQNFVSRKIIKEKTVNLTIIENKARWGVTIVTTGRENTYAPGHECLPSLVENSNYQRLYNKNSQKETDIVNHSQISSTTSFCWIFSNKPHSTSFHCDLIADHSPSILMTSYSTNSARFLKSGNLEPTSSAVV